MNIVKQFRDKYSLTQQQAADRLGYKSWVSVSYWETGKRPIPWTVKILINNLKEK